MKYKCHGTGRRYLNDAPELVDCTGCEDCLVELKETQTTLPEYTGDIITLYNPDIEITPGGGKHTRLDTRCDLLPPAALLQCARVIKTGSEKYGANNWRAIDRRAHVNHALTHVLEYLINGRTSELTNATCRLLFALETDDGPEGAGGQARVGIPQSRTRTKGAA